MRVSIYVSNVERDCSHRVLDGYWPDLAYDGALQIHVLLFCMVQEADFS